jgi:two-component system chemotaxis response regulator CheB
VIRILVVDDSPVVQAILTKIFKNEPDFELVGVASNGEEAVSMTLAFKPDLITMDIRMPKMNGFEATKIIMEKWPTPIVVVCASVDAPDVAISYKALKAGALTILEKPTALNTFEAEAVKNQLITTLRLMAEVKVVTRRGTKTRIASLSARLKKAQPLSQPKVQRRIFAIGTSTGGPGALRNIFCSLPLDFNGSILIVQHISKGFLEGLANWLCRESKIKVKVAEDGEPLKSGVAYLGPSDYHLELNKDRTIKLTQNPPICGFRPSVTALFSSMAQNYGFNSVGILLTGMGDDGVEGLKAIKKAGGRTIVQDEESCVVFGMPHEAIKLGVVDKVASLEEISSIVSNNT